MFNPLGAFDPNAPLLPEALAAARALDLPAIRNGLITRVYEHWSAAGCSQTFSDYNLMVVLKDGQWQLVVTHDPQDNAPGVNDNAPASHTWRRNTGALGVCIAAMAGGQVSDFGASAPNVHEIEFLCAGVAALCVAYDVDTLGVVANGFHKGEHNILTHSECATIDNYEDERWDLMSLVAAPPGTQMVSPERRAYEKTTGDALRARAHKYAAALRVAKQLSTNQ